MFTVNIILLYEAAILLFKRGITHTASEAVGMPAAAIDMQKITVGDHFLTALANLSLTLKIKHNSIVSRTQHVTLYVKPP